jgi:hypothetical protein
MQSNAGTAPLSGVWLGGLSIRNGVLLHKQLIHPMMDYACHVWRSAARPHIRLQSKRFRIATSAPWSIGNRQTQENLGVPYFSDHITYERFDSKLADVGNHSFAWLGRRIRWPSAGLSSLKQTDRFTFRLLFFFVVFLSWWANARAYLARRDMALPHKLDGKSFTLLTNGHSGFDSQKAFQPTSCPPIWSAALSTTLVCELRNI